MSDGDRSTTLGGHTLQERDHQRILATFPLLSHVVCMSSFIPHNPEQKFNA